ncbi:MAG: class I SAM-dependent methyltransferase [Bacteroidota bacterium]
MAHNLVALLLFASQVTVQNIYSSDKWQERDHWQKAPEIMKEMGIKSGDAVADIGSHQGYMTIKFSNRVGSSGKVYAVDVNHSHLSKLGGLLDSRNISNVETIHSDYDDPKLPKESIDYAFIMDAYHEMDDHMDILKHVKNALRPVGKLVVLEPIQNDRRAEPGANRKVSMRLT